MYCHSCQLCRGSVFLLVIASANCFIESPEIKKGDEGLECGGSPQQNGFKTVAPCNRGTTGVTNVGAVPVVEPDGLDCMKSDVTWLCDLTAACTWVEERCDVGA